MEMDIESFENLKKELAKLKSKLPKLQQNYMDAVNEGDGGHDNILWQRSLEDLDRCKDKIFEYEEMLRKAKVTSKSNSSQISLGSDVTIQEENGKEKQLKIVEEFEVNPVQGKISKASVLGKALIGKKSKDYIEIQTPAGLKKYLIINIK